MSLLRKIQVFSSNVAKLWTIDEANTARTTSTIVGVVQNVDQTGKVAPAGDTISNAPFVKITDGLGTEPVDVNQHSLGVIDHPHKETHEGNHFTATNIFTSIASGAYADIRIKPGEVYKPHLIFSITSDTAKVTIELREACTFSGNGTALVAYNNNRGSANTTTLAALTHSPTINGAGTTIYQTFMGSASQGNSKSSSQTSSRIEFMLNTNTEYCLRVLNNHTGTQSIAVELEWYEPIT